MAIHNDRVSKLTQSRKLVQVSPDPNCHYFLPLLRWQYGDPLWSIHDLPLFVYKKNTPTFINAKDDNVGSNATRIWNDPTFYHLQSEVPSLHNLTTTLAQNYDIRLYCYRNVNDHYHHSLLKTTCDDKHSNQFQLRHRVCYTLPHY